MSVRIDGVEVARKTVSTTSYAEHTFTLPASVAAGAQYVVERADGNMGRNQVLTVDYLTFDAPDYPLPPPPGGISLGVYQGSFYNHGNTSGIDSEAALIGRWPKVMMWYPNAAEKWPFERAKCDYAFSHGALPHLTWEWFGISYSSINSGAHDAYIDSYAQACASWGKPILMRVFHEMNGNWYSWNLGQGAAAHKAAWQRIVTHFRNRGASNVRFFWCPNEGGTYDSALQAAFPGDAYIDMVGIDGYNWGTTNGGWHSAEQIFRGKYNLLTSWSTKPFGVGETGSREAGGSKAAWVAQARDQLASNVPRLTHVTLFDDNFGGFSDWRLNSSQTALDAYKQLVGAAGWQGTLA
jgi:hypothetical protein